MPKEKFCSRCNTLKPILDFGIKKTAKDGYQLWCKKCTSEYAKTYRKCRKDKVRQWGRRCDLKRDYGITQEDYNKMFEQQEGHCAICDKPERAKINGRLKVLAVDHNHKTGQIRGLLCQVCNTRLAYIEDLEFITKARIYLDGYNFISKPEKQNRYSINIEI